MFNQNNFLSIDIESYIFYKENSASFLNISKWFVQNVSKLFSFQSIFH